jgi:subtilisin family serine protease
MELETVVIRSDFARQLTKRVTGAGSVEPEMVSASAAVQASSPEDRLNSLTTELVGTKGDDIEKLAKDDDVLLTITNLTVSTPIWGAAQATYGEGGSGAGELPKISWGIPEIGADGLDENAGDGVRVAILDTGIESGHPAFAAMGDRLVTRNFTGEADEDIDGHGTHVAGTVFGADVRGHRMGIARGIEKAFIGKIIGENGGKVQVVVDALLWALSKKAHIINMSIGIDFVSHYEFLRKYHEHKIGERAALSMVLAGYRASSSTFDRLSDFLMMNQRSAFGGALAVGASGNLSFRPSYTITTEPPASGERMTAVSAVERNAAGELKVCSFANDDVDIAAPGRDIMSAWKDGKLRMNFGTSMAAPHVCGAAAVVASHMQKETGDFNASDLRDVLVKHARTIPAGRKDVGAGLVQIPEAYR